MFSLFFPSTSSQTTCLSLIRPLLIRSGTKPVIGLTLGVVTGAAIVLAANYLRMLIAAALIFVCEYDLHVPLSDLPQCFLSAIWEVAAPPSRMVWWSMEFAWPALAVFVWLPLFALGIVAARLLTPLSWIVGRTQWFLKEGKEHPLKANGYVASVVVFIGTVAGRVVFSA
jgi:hypothetical protein